MERPTLLPKPGDENLPWIASLADTPFGTVFSNDPLVAIMLPVR
jgi:hypothetical protein